MLVCGTFVKFDMDNWKKLQPYDDKGYSLLDIIVNCAVKEYLEKNGESLKLLLED